MTETIKTLLRWIPPNRHISTYSEQELSDLRTLRSAIERVMDDNSRLIGKRLEELAKPKFKPGDKVQRGCSDCIVVAYEHVDGDYSLVKIRCIKSRDEWMEEGEEETCFERHLASCDDSP